MPGMEALLRSGWRASLRRRAAQCRPATAAEHLRDMPVQAVASQPPIRGRREGRQGGEKGGQEWKRSGNLKGALEGPAPSGALTQTPSDHVVDCCSPLWYSQSCRLRSSSGRRYEIAGRPARPRRPRSRTRQLSPRCLTAGARNWARWGNS